ncbi:MAG: tetratricopeptide repeat protein, partial [Lachnospiraceae bacterium]|nr:tetratricopeptide repeat protein [Lachnospiraceae bacterium]
MLKKIAACLIACALMLTGCGKSAGKIVKAGQKLENGDYEEAEAIYSEVIESGKYVSEAYRGLGICQISEGMYADACISFEKALLYTKSQSAEYTRDVELYLAYSRQHHGENDKALEIYDGIIARDASPDVLYLRGKLYMDEGRTEEASEDFDRAASLSEDYDLFINIYEVYASHDKKADGSSYLERALQIVSGSEKDYYNKGLVHYYLQNYEESKTNLISALDEDPSDSASILLLGRVYLSMGLTADARAMFNDHIMNGSNAAAAYNGLAMCDMEEEKYEAAMENINAGLALDDPEADRGLMYNSIIAYEHLKDWNAAKAQAAAFVQKYPTDEAGL